VFWCGKCTLQNGLFCSGAVSVRCKLVYCVLVRCLLQTGLLCSGAVCVRCKLVYCVLVRYVYVANWFIVFWCGKCLLQTVYCVFAMEFNFFEL